MRVRGVVVVAGVVCACNLPTRDNLNDPAYAPEAVLRISPLDGGRQTDFDLDASESIDPFGRGALRYQWDFDYHLGDVDFDADTGTAAVVSNHKFSLTSQELCEAGFCDGVGSIQRIVRVVVTASSGHYAEATASVLVRNEAPSVSAGEDLYVSEILPTPVELDGCGGGSPDVGSCTTVDSDGDAPIGFTWHWEQEFGTDVAIVNSNSRIASFTIETEDPRPYVFRVTASDGLTSSSALVRVFRESQLWIGSTSPTRMMRAFPEGAYIQDPPLGNGPISSLQYYLTAAVLAPDGVLWFSQTSAGWQGGPTADDPQVVRMGRAFTPPKSNPQWTITTSPQLDQPGEGVVSLVAHSSLSGCAAVHDNEQATWVRLAPPLLVRIDTRPETIRTAAFVANAQGSPADPDDCWTVDAKGGIGKLDTAAFWTEIEPPSAVSLNPTSRVTMAIADDTARLWVAEHDGMGTFFDTSDDVAQLRIMENQDITSTPVPIPADVKRIVRLAAWTDGEVWVNSRERGLSLVSSDGTWMEPVIESSMPLTGDDITNLGADPAGSVVWIARGASGTLHRMEYVGGVLAESGRLSVEDIYQDGGIAPFSKIVPDPLNGSAFVYVGAIAETQKVIARVPPHLRRVADVPADDFTFLQTMFAGGRGGTVWLSRPYRIEGTNQGRGLVRLTHSGRKVVDLPDLIVGASDVAHDGTMWTIEGNQLVHRGHLGEILGSYPTGSTVPVVSLSISKSFGCLAYDSQNPLPRTGGAARIDLTNGAITNLDTMVAGTSWIPSLTTAASDDACWFVAKPAANPGCCIAAQGSGCANNSFPRALRYAPGEITPSVTLQFDDDQNLLSPRTPELRDDPTCPLSVDADPYDGGLWVADFDYDSSRVRRIDKTSTEVKRIGGYNNPPLIPDGATRVSVDRCPGFDLACRRIYVLTSVDALLYNQDAVIVNAWRFPAGQPVGMAFSR